MVRFSFKILKMILILVVIFSLKNDICFSSIIEDIAGNSLVPYSALSIENWVTSKYEFRGFFLKVPKNTIEVDVLILGVGAKASLYTYSFVSGRLQKINKLSEAVTPPTDWTRLKISKLKKDTDLFLEIDFSSAEGYFKGVNYK